jgi:hypothetical protein
MSRPIRDLTGKKFGLLKVTGFAFIKGHAYWHCRCRCGSEKDIRQDTLLAGVTVSCSCRKINSWPSATAGAAVDQRRIPTHAGTESVIR